MEIFEVGCRRGVKIIGSIVKYAREAEKENKSTTKPNTSPDPGHCTNKSRSF